MLVIDSTGIHADESMACSEVRMRPAGRELAPRLNVISEGPRSQSDRCRAVLMAQTQPQPPHNSRGWCPSAACRNMGKPGWLEPVYSPQKYGSRVKAKNTGTLFLFQPPTTCERTKSPNCPPELHKLQAAQKRGHSPPEQPVLPA